MKTPEGLKWLSNFDSGASWLDNLPKLIAELSEHWGIELGSPYSGSNVSYVAPARRDHQLVVLKVQWPHRESAHEADALRVWSGGGAVRMLAHDAVRHALLLEHCSPGTTLSTAETIDKIGVLIDVLPRLWRPVGAPFRALCAEAAYRRKDLLAEWETAGRPFERRLVEAARSLLADLPSDQGEPVLVHQDLHGDNVLAAEREPWLVIDPKPLAGERELALAPIIRSSELGHSREAVIRRLDRLSSELGLDRDRARGWAIAQTVAWGLDSTCASTHAATARWLLDDVA